MDKKGYYKILGVAKNATKEEIKKAYKEKAKKHHPDNQGDKEQFTEINLAYVTLTDSKKRKHYDETGEDLPKDQIRIVAIELLATLLYELLNKDIPLNIDLIQIMKDSVRNKSNEISNQLNKVTSITNKTQKIRKNLTQKGKDNILESILDRKEGDLTKEKESVLNTLKSLNEALLILENYGFTPEGAEWISQRIKTFTGTFSTTSSGIT